MDDATFVFTHAKIIAADVEHQSTADEITAGAGKTFASPDIDIDIKTRTVLKQDHRSSLSSKLLPSVEADIIMSKPIPRSALQTPEPSPMPSRPFPEFEDGRALLSELLFCECAEAGMHFDNNQSPEI